jgi:hypothetical protein
MIVRGTLGEVLLYIGLAMGPAASCQQVDICC